MPDPFTPKIGFGMKVAWRSLLSATFLTMKRQVLTLSAVTSTSS
jgi:hypothetical protein